MPEKERGHRVGTPLTHELIAHTGEELAGLEELLAIDCPLGGECEAETAHEGLVV